MFFTRPGQGPFSLTSNGVGSLPNMESALSARKTVPTVKSSGLLPNRFASSPSFNGSNRPKSSAPAVDQARQPKSNALTLPQAIQDSSKVSSKPSSPHNLGLLGPICWRSSGGDCQEVEMVRPSSLSMCFHSIHSPNLCCLSCFAEERSRHGPCGGSRTPPLGFKPDVEFGG